MCGFLGEFLFKKEAFISENAFSDILAFSKHRGSDDTKILKEINYRLGFNRLSILDLSTNGSQPKQSPSKRYNIVFNGEIYNYKALSKTYNLKNLNSTSDTEVLVYLLDVLGVKETLKVLNGMFAMMIVDTKENNCYMARDFAGIKPLFFGISDYGLVTASQFNQIHKHPWFIDKLQLSSDVVKGYFSYGYMLAPDTIYKDIHQVKPGELITVNSHGDINSDQFYAIETTIDYSEINEAILKSKLEAAVKHQMLSDVPLGTFLSGGIDSPLISAIAKSKSEDLEAFTLSVNDDVLDETEKATAYGAHLGISHHLIDIAPEELLKEVDAHFKFMTEPFGDYSSIPTYAVTKGAKSSKTVMLSGDGGDELFFGYPRMLHVIKLRHWFKVPFLIRKPLSRLAIKLGFLKSWAPYNFETFNDFVKAKQSYINKKVIVTAFPNTNDSNAFTSLFKFHNTFSKDNLLQKLRLNEFYGHLQRVLIKVDRMSMANSLEVRVPFLDKEIIDYTFKWFPKELKSKADLKYPLKKLLESYYPKPLIEEEKKGFAVPIDKWLRNQLKSDLERVIFNTPIYGNSNFEESVMQNYVNDFLNKKHDEAWGVWHIYAWQKWAINEGLL